MSSRHPNRTPIRQTGGVSMQRFCTVFLLLLAMRPVLMAAAQQESGCTLLIHADGFRNDRGKAGAALFNSANGWPENASLSVQHLPFPIKDGKSELSFTNIPSGQYAVAMFHDEKMTQKISRNFLGMPTEGFGFSNNPKIYLHPPSYNEAAFDLRCPVTEIAIHLVHLH